MAGRQTRLAHPPSDLSRLRLFIALWPDAATRAALVALQAGMLGRLTAPGQLHLTLAFLGHQPATALPLLQALLTTFPTTPLPLKLNHCGYFARQQLAWIGPEPAPAALLALQRQLSAGLTQQLPGYQAPPHFLSHVTLARKIAAAPPTSSAAIEWRSEQIVLVQSCALEHGTHYQVLAAHALNPTG